MCVCVCVCVQCFLLLHQTTKLPTKASGQAPKTGEKKREFGLRDCVAQCFFQSLSFFLVYQQQQQQPSHTFVQIHSLIERILQFGPSPTPTDHPNQDDQQQFQQETKRPTTTTTTTTTARWESCHIVDRWHWASLLPSLPHFLIHRLVVCSLTSASQSALEEGAPAGRPSFFFLTISLERIHRLLCFCFFFHSCTLTFYL